MHPSKKCIAHGWENSGGWKLVDIKTGTFVASYQNFNNTNCYATQTPVGVASNNKDVNDKSKNIATITCIKFSETGRMLICGDARGCVSVFNFVLAKRIMFIPFISSSPNNNPSSTSCGGVVLDGAVKCVSLSPRENFMAVDFANNSIKVFKIQHRENTSPKNKENLMMPPLLFELKRDAF